MAAIGETAACCTVAAKVTVHSVQRRPVAAKGHCPAAVEGLLFCDSRWPVHWSSKGETEQEYVQVYLFWIGLRLPQQFCSIHGLGTRHFTIVAFVEVPSLDTGVQAFQGVGLGPFPKLGSQVILCDGLGAARAGTADLLDVASSLFERQAQLALALKALQVRQPTGACARDEHHRELGDTRAHGELVPHGLPVRPQ